jgi:hypothetical protein
MFINFKLKPLSGVLLVVLIILFIPWGFLEGVEIGQFRISLNEYSGFGSYVSGIVSIFVFLLVFMTYRAQREELNKSIDIFNTQTEIQNKQAELVQKQLEQQRTFQFDQSFYQLLNVFQIEKGKREHEINQLTQSFLTKVQKNLQTNVSALLGLGEVQITKDNTELYQTIVNTSDSEFKILLENQGSFLTYYFRLYARLFVLIKDKGDITSDQLINYSSIASEMLSNNELFFFDKLYQTKSLEVIGNINQELYLKNFNLTERTEFIVLRQGLPIYILLNKQQVYVHVKNSVYNFIKTREETRETIYDRVNIIIENEDNHSFKFTVILNILNQEEKSLEQNERVKKLRFAEAFFDF